MTERARCSRCGMTFRIEERPRSQRDSIENRADMTTCAEPNCRIRFWHTCQVGMAEKRFSKVGIEPQDYYGMAGLVEAIVIEDADDAAA